MISALIGRPGEGKSLHGSMMIRDLLDSGISVYSNLHVDESRQNFHYFETKNWEVIYQLQDGVVIFDEGQFILDARNWQNLPVEFRQLLQKGRHEGLDFFILTQNIMQLDVSARRLIHEAKTVMKFFSSARLGFGLFAKFDVDLNFLDKQKTTGFPNFSIPTRSDFNYYNSTVLRSIKERIPQFTCGTCGRLHEIGVHRPHLPVQGHTPLA